jgi:hypothetical protein
LASDFMNRLPLSFLIDDILLEENLLIYEKEIRI